MKTLTKVINLEGIGLHTGRYITCKILPDEQNPIHFIRTDRDDKPIVAETHQVWQTHWCTQIATHGNNSVSTIEHLMAALTLHEIDHARIELNGEEVPILDGSAIIWSRQIVARGIPEKRKHSSLMKVVQKGDSCVILWAHSQTNIHASIQFGEWYESYHYDGQIHQIMGARSFVLEEWVEHLKQKQLIQGGKLTNALVKMKEGWKNGPPRWENEAARHKVLDLLGDLSLAKVSKKHMMISYKSGHALHIQMAKAI
nr:UDP-3-O-[3-hydroxymyristoyl] GlcNAc deacetylase [Cyanidioschyzonaceae sp. 3]WDB00422.1 UDP-3-0-acyl N-acetylglucosamine deacetylase [Cyanidiococcus yangmingshanensis]